MNESYRLESPHTTHSRESQTYTLESPLPSGRKRTQVWMLPKHILQPKSKHTKLEIGTYEDDIEDAWENIDVGQLPTQELKQPEQHEVEDNDGLSDQITAVEQTAGLAASHAYDKLLIPITKPTCMFVPNILRLQTTRRTVHDGMIDVQQPPTELPLEITGTLQGVTHLIARIQKATAQLNEQQVLVRVLNRFGSDARITLLECLNRICGTNETLAMLEGKSPTQVQISEVKDAQEICAVLASPPSLSNHANQAIKPAFPILTVLLDFDIFFTASTWQDRIIRAMHSSAATETKVASDAKTENNESLLSVESQSPQPLMVKDYSLIGSWLQRTLAIARIAGFASAKYAEEAGYSLSSAETVLKSINSSSLDTSTAALTIFSGVVMVYAEPPSETPSCDTNYSLSLRQRIESLLLLTDSEYIFTPSKTEL